MCDSDVENEAITRIRSDNRLASRNIKIIVKNGQIMISGSVHSYYEKQLAQERLVRINGCSVSNQLQVQVISEEIP